MSNLSAITSNSLQDYAVNASPKQKEELQGQIRELVGQVFYGTMLAQMRGSMDEENPLNGGKAGQTYARQLDQELISNLSRSTSFEVGQKIAEIWTGDTNTTNSISTNQFETFSQELSA